MNISNPLSSSYFPHNNLVKWAGLRTSLIFFRLFPSWGAVATPFLGCSEGLVIQTIRTNHSGKPLNCPTHGNQSFKHRRFYYHNFPLFFPLSVFLSFRRYQLSSGSFYRNGWQQFAALTHLFQSQPYQSCVHWLHPHLPSNPGMKMA